MSLLGQFAAPVGAMMAQSKKLETIGLNVANLNTGGYKRTETNFSTMIAKTYGNNMDIGGVRGISRSMISQQGALLSSASNYDVAINGNGFFMLNSEIDGSGTTVFGRDGTLEQQLGDEIDIVVNGNNVKSREGYLVDKNGYFLQGWPVNPDLETFPTDEASLQSLRIDPEAFTTNGEATTTASLGVNLPSDAGLNYNESTFIKAYDNNGDFTSFQVKFTNLVLGSTTENVATNWNLSSTAAVGDTISQDVTVYDVDGYTHDVSLQFTKTGADAWDLRVIEESTELDIDGTDDGITNAVPITFTGGVIDAPVPAITVDTNRTNGAVFALDLSNMTQTALATDTATSTVDGIKAAEVKNQWTMEIYDASDNALNIDTDTTPTRLVLEFDGSGALKTPTNLTIPAAAGDIALDISEITNYASGSIAEVFYEYNGRSDARLQSFEFNSSGEVIGRFSDATQRKIYKLPLATFTNPDALEPINGNVYKYEPNAGKMVVRTASGQGAGEFVPNARETSNVEMSDEFTNMIMTQNAYNTASTMVKTIDEMTQVARDLKR
ncbi:flagellar hook-basal body complex protein [Terasakiella sp. SH-1]|uniref:flagellar hook-basal body complex protein n=1 Tax=Terasakiella sp. SH-1 TaxID=2560057 RepID=UPI0010731611|nr:flagellar hook-basal body complex protein [Terasakiella sp. SH-1]